MSKLIHTSRVRIYQDKRPIRRAFIEHFKEPVFFGMHGGIRDFYGIESEEEEHPTTLDYIIAGVGG